MLKMPVVRGKTSHFNRLFASDAWLQWCSGCDSPENVKRYVPELLLAGSILRVPESLVATHKRGLPNYHDGVLPANDEASGDNSRTSRIRIGA